VTPDVDALRLAFEPGTLVALNAVLGLVMFGVALDLSVEDFRRVARSPLGAGIGLLAQFVLLPAVTWGLTMVLDVRPSIALGMILVAACPGGNISKLISSHHGGVPVTTSFTQFISPPTRRP